MTSGPYSDHLQERIRKFDTLIENTTDVIATLDERHFVPEILPVVRQLGRVCEEAFMVNFSDDGRVSIPESEQGGEGFGIVPLLDRNEELYCDATFTMSTAKRIAVSALQHGVEPSKLYEVARQETIDYAAAGWSGPAGLGGLGSNTGAYLHNYYGYNEVEGASVYRVSRPCVVVGPKVFNLLQTRRGVAGIHEFVHGLDWQETADPGKLTVDVVDRNSSRWEQRAYHVCFGALMSADEDFTAAIQSGDWEKVLPVDRTMIRVEQVRRQKSTPDDPFATPPVTVELLNKLGVLGTLAD